MLFPDRRSASCVPTFGILSPIPQAWWELAMSLKPFLRGSRSGPVSNPDQGWRLTNSLHARARTPMKVLLASLALGCGSFAQTTLNVSQDLVRLGIASSNIVPNQPSLDAG